MGISYADGELVVVDDHSTDGSVEMPRSEKAAGPSEHGSLPKRKVSRAGGTDQMNPTSLHESSTVAQRTGLGPRILFLSAEAMGYTEALLRVLVRQHAARVTLVCWGEDGKRTPHQIELRDGVETIPRGSLTARCLKRVIDSRRPSLIYVAGWMDMGYLEAARYARSRGVKVVAGMDTQWTGSTKQRASALLLQGFWRKHFDYFWVPGNRQEEYAIRLGFRDRILPDLLSADIALFGASWERARESKVTQYPRILLFVGRLVREKGVDLLSRAFLAAKIRTGSEWRLLIAGTGCLLEAIPKSPDIRCVGFRPPAKLAALMDECGAFCMPSRLEPWGIAIHEAAAAGLPLVLTDACGAADRFLASPENGYLVQAGRLAELTEALAQLMGLPDDALMAMGARSHSLARGIDPEGSASSLLSVLHEGKTPHLAGRQPQKQDARRAA